MPALHLEPSMLNGNQQGQLIPYTVKTTTELINIKTEKYGVLKMLKDQLF